MSVKHGQACMACMAVKDHKLVCQIVLSTDASVRPLMSARNREITIVFGPKNGCFGCNRSLVSRMCAHTLAIGEECL